jgi:heat shock protein HslJ
VPDDRRLGRAILAAMRHAKLAVVLLALVLGATVAGCGDASDDSGGAAGSGTTTLPEGATAATPSVGQLADKRFASTHVDGRTLVAGTALQIHFSAQRLGASAGCNTLSSGYIIDGGRLLVHPNMAQSLVGCAPALVKQDRWLTRFLANGPKIELHGERLTLTEGAVRVELVAG